MVSIESIKSCSDLRLDVLAFQEANYEDIE